MIRFDLRDYLAGQVLSGTFAAVSPDTPGKELRYAGFADAEELATICYEIADTMLLVRQIKAGDR